MNPAESAFYDQLGRHMAECRKELGITQVQLAQMLGIAQQTMTHDEGGEVRIAASVLPIVADALNVGIEALIGREPKKGKPAAAQKRGPTPKIQQQLQQLSKLPKAKQRAIEQVLESVLASAA